MKISALRFSVLVAAGGLLVSTGTAAIAQTVSEDSAAWQDEGPEQASSSEGQSEYPGGPEVSDPRNPDAQMSETDSAPQGDQRDDSAAYGSIGGAVDVCASELSRTGKTLDSVQNARRMGQRFTVEGKLADGRPYACSVDDTGQIRSVAVDGQGIG
ncbi:hypothetical protein [Novosphingobium sp. Leaf2]|uniref:hypothetical protein n=1 Tax=Novosphingobium sp. Leaf2 TaxID=1735670 RepID=UPI0006F80F29|nr:hypothetical protein [Novosphingobium sp. Leaf2]KQM19559.1 hypothetical protein ASE49_04885 [Novosphingobium sp. Leaf2]